ncbi:multiubiquitin domain-containing protein [Microbispora hainanensis]|uniref:multiubiquitin domain-containing protein n=1 Tax=Microbispora hainanensis TaxID=568844 RepID=UPI0033F61E72
MTVTSETEAVQHHVVVITVNERPVHINGPRVTGLQIKEAAIMQGLAIELSFLLSEELPSHRTHPVGDSDVVTVTKNSRFTAVADDDNS